MALPMLEHHRKRCIGHHALTGITGHLISRGKAAPEARGSSVTQVGD